MGFKAFDVNDGIEAYKTGLVIKNNKDDRAAQAEEAATKKKEAISRKQLETSAQLAQKWAMTPNISKDIIKQDIDGAYSAGAFDEPTYQKQVAHMAQLPDDPQSLSDWSKSLVAQTMKAHEVMGFLQPTADNKLDNDTSRANAQLSTNTSIRGQDITMRGQDLTNSLGRDRLNVDALNHVSTNAENARYHDIQGKNFQDNLALERQKAAMTGTGKAASEDERKGAAWLSQADNAYKNMLSAMKTYPGADSPGILETIAPDALKGATQGTGRQLFTQAASSLSEALLRAATGAGVNRDEAIQKIREITPEYFDGAERRKQKLDSIPVYLESLKTRAGRAAPGGYEIPTPNNQIAPQGVDPKKYAKLVQGGVDPKEAEEFLREQGGQ
jgi:hypothetical protein